MEFKRLFRKLFFGFLAKKKWVYLISKEHTVYEEIYVDLKKELEKNKKRNTTLIKKRVKLLMKQRS